MKHWIGGIALAVLAFVLLYASAVVSQTASVVSLVLLLGCVLLVLAGFFVIAHASKHMPAPAPKAAAPAAGGAAAPVDSAPWAGTGKTLGVALVGVVGLLVYVGIYVGAWADIMGWIIYLAIFLTFSMLVLIVMLTMGKTE